MNLLREYIRELLVEKAIGLCFPFAVEKAEEWWRQHLDRSKPRGKGIHPDIDNLDKFKVIHGRTTNKWNGESVEHAWVEMGDMIFDWQTHSTKPNGISREVYYDMYQPDIYKVYTAEETVKKCMMSGHAGPWGER